MSAGGIPSPTVQTVRDAWLAQFWFAGPSEKHDATVEIEAFLAPLGLTSGEPARPLPCSNCEVSYEACTKRILGGRKACCGTCGRTTTHNQDAWEKWDREQRRLTPSEPVAPGGLRPKERWASVNKREWPATGGTVHVVQKGADTSLCGTTAMPHTLWRGTNRKPPCPECTARLKERR